MNFRKNMDSLWLTLNHKIGPIISSLIAYFTSYVVVYYLEIDPFVFLGVVLIGLTIFLKSFYSFFFNSLGRGYDDLIKVYKSELRGKEKRSNIFRLILLVISVFYILGYFLGAIKQNGILTFAGLLGVFLILVIYGLIEWFIDSTPIQNVSKNYVVAIVLTDSKFVIYSRESKIMKFDRSTFKATFSGRRELTLADSSSQETENIVVNITHLSNSDKHELQSLLAQDPKSLETTPTSKNS